MGDQLAGHDVGARGIDWVALTLTGGEWDPTVRHLGGPAMPAMLALCRADWVYLGVSADYPIAGVTSASRSSSPIPEIGPRGAEPTARPTCVSGAG